MRYDAASILLFDNSGRVLLQHRTDDAPAFPGFWSFFGGQIETGETPEEAVKRETFEELKYTLKDPKFIHKFRYSDNSSGRVGTIYLFAEQYDSKQKLVLCEGQEMKFFSITDLDAIKMIDLDRAELKKIMNGGLC
jgi:8-oxo-dGTP diphosphatase